MSFGDVLREAASPTGSPQDIGGDANTIWHGQYAPNKVVELSTTDFSVIRQADPPAPPNGIGGDADTIWMASYVGNKVYELSTADFSVVRQADAPLRIANGIGGDSYTIWHCANDPDKIYELSIIDFSVVRQADAITTNSQGIGGDYNTIWHCDVYAPYKVYELSTTDFSMIREADAPGTWLEGIGGDHGTIWHSDADTDKIYELYARSMIVQTTVATTTEVSATAWGYMRKGFYAAGRFWAFYITANIAYYESTADPEDWSGAVTSIGACSDGWQFSIWFDGTYVHYIRYSSNDLFYRRGIPEDDGTITWSAAEQTAYNGGAGDKYEFPCITVDSSGYAWIGAIYTGNTPYALKNANNDGTWAMDFATQLSVTADFTTRICPVPLTLDKVYLIYIRDGQPPLGKLYDAGFGAEESDLADFNIEGSNAFSSVANGDDLHFIYNRDTTNQIRHNKRTFGVGWGAADVLVQDAVMRGCSPALFIYNFTGDLYCYWTQTDTDHVYYKKHSYAFDTWDVDPTDVIDESIDDIKYDYLITSYYQDCDGYNGLLYLTKTSSPYDVKVAISHLPLMYLPNIDLELPAGHNIDLEIVI